ncbi:MAG: hypothetical protein WCR27_09870 [Eubacteriales bacterium]|jgi:hypothetical protein
MNNEKSEEVHIDKDGIHVSENGQEKVHISKNGVHIHDKHTDIDEPNPKLPRCPHYYTIKSSLYSLSFLAATAAYLLLGFLLPDNQGWANWWPLFIIFPVIPSIFEAIANRSFCRFLMPLLVTAVYCFIGMQWNLWHPWWILFFIIPAYYIIFGPIDSAIKRIRIKKFVKKHGGNVDIDIDDDDDDDDDDIIDTTK